MSYSGLQHLLNNEMVDGLDVDTSTDKPDCVACTEAKLARTPYGPTVERFTKPGGLVHVDLWGKYDKSSIQGNSYYLLLVDDASRFVTVEFLKSKRQAGQRIKDYVTHLMARGLSPCVIRMDHGTEFINEDLRTWCHSKRIRYQMTAPHSPSQNGVAERMNRTLEELSRAMLIDLKLPEFLWEPAVVHAAYVRNMSWTKHNPTATPYQLWHRRKPNVSNLREFGAPVWVLAEGQRVMRKMLPKSHRRAYVGYDEGLKSVKYYNAETKMILTSRNYKFLIPSNSSPPKILLIDPGPESPQLEGEHKETSRTEQPIDNDLHENGQPSEQEMRPTRVPRGPRMDYKYLNDPFPDEEEAEMAYVVKVDAPEIPPSDKCRDLRQARKSLEWPKWEKAIQSELDQLDRMGTWKLVDKPPHAIPISNRFVFNKKFDNAGNILKYKARLVAKGYTQRPGFNYVDMHSPVVQMETIRAILAIAPTRKLIIHQLDIKGAYLNGTLKEEIYMRQPKGYGDSTNQVCHLIKTLYGLKQAGREWNLEIDRKMQGKGYVRLRSDACVYIWHMDDDFVIITVWVDDMLLFTTTTPFKEKAIADISNEWEITDLGTPTKIIGIELAISPDAISISSTK